MSTDNPAATPAIRRTLDDLRARIRRYVLIEGVSAVVAILCIIFWITLSLDVVHFQLRKLELPGWFRTICSLGALGLLAGAVAVWLFARLMRSFRSRALALVLEKRFPELGDRLITAVELSDDPSRKQTDLGGAMLQRTIDDAAAAAGRLDLGSVFNPAPLRRWVIAAAVLVVSVLGFGALRTQAMERWFNAFVLLRDDYWEPYRRSAMTVKVLVQPGDQVREFAADGSYKHPRGADLTLLAEVPDGREVPSDVSLSYRAFGGAGTNRGTVPMSQSGERKFRHTLSRIIDEHQLWVTGGDFVNRRPFRVLVVDPPRIDGITLRCDYPDYTGWDALGDRDRAVQGTQVSLPVETSFIMRASTNKPLIAVQIRCREFDLKLSAPRGGSPGESTFTVHSSESVDAGGTAASRVVVLPDETVAGWFGADGQSFSVPFVLATAAHEQLGEIARGGKIELPLPLTSDTQLQIYLEDTDEVSSADPALLTINGIRDTEPVVETRRKGIGASITRMAEIPVEGRITDDYGVVDAHFGFRVEEETEYTARPLDVPPGGQRDFTLGPSEGDRTERFRVLPLEMQVDQKLAVTVFATDGDNLNGPHESHGEVYTFTIVTPEELLAQLYDKEVNLRQRFEQIRREVQQVRDDLLLHQQRYAEGRTLREAPPADEAAHAQWEEQLRQIAVAVSASAERSLHLVRKSHTECRSVEVGFGEIREEMVNNRVDTATALQRIDFGILQPLHGINETDYPDVDQQIGLFRLANENGADPTSAIDGSLVAIDRMLARMDQILVQMREREGYNEMIKMIQDILERSESLRDETQKEQERRFFDLLN